MAMTPGPLNHCRPSTFSAACPGCGRTLLGLLAALSAGLPTVFAAVTVVVLVSLFPATVEGQGDSEPCPGGGYNPTPTAVEVTAVPIVVTSTTADYFVLYVRHDVDTNTTVEIPVLVKRGAGGTTTLAENVEALPKERYRVEKYLIADPADVDGDCVDDITELGDPVSMNPVNPAAAIALSVGTVAIPDRDTFDKLSYRDKYIKFVMFGMDTADRPGVYFMNTENYPDHRHFMEVIGLDWEQDGLLNGELTFHPELMSPSGNSGVYYYEFQREPSFSLMGHSHTLLAASIPLLDDNLALYISNGYLKPELCTAGCTGVHLRRPVPQGTIGGPPKTWGKKVGWRRFPLRQPTPRRSPKWLPNENSIAPQGPSNKAGARGPRGPIKSGLPRLITSAARI